MLHGVGRQIELTSDKVNRCRWGGAQVIGRKTQIPQRTQLQREAQAIVVPTLALDSLDIAVGQREVGAQILVRNLVRKPVQSFALGFGQKSDWHGSEPPRIDASLAVRRGVGRG